jgi:hypothetical protein
MQMPAFPKTNLTTSRRMSYGGGMTTERGWLIFVAASLLAGCGGGRSNGAAGQPCDVYLSCLQSVVASGGQGATYQSSLTSAQAQYGPAGTCGASRSARAACDSACTMALQSVHSAMPQVDGCVLAPTAMNGTVDPNVDSDHDGYSPAMGDCDDTTPLIGPNSFEVPGNGIDDDCDGQVDNVKVCDTSVAGQKTADALVKAMGICDKFVTGSNFNGPSAMGARNTLAKFGVLNALEGSAMAYISTGDASGSASYNPQPGTDFMGVTPVTMFPYLHLQPATMGCGAGNPTELNDYLELEVDLTVPTNANSFSFQSQFFSAEYPEFVCTMFNDRFLVIVDDGNNPQQIEFDMNGNPVTVNSGFFTVCQNDPSKPQTQHCNMPITAIKGTGFDQSDFDPFGGGSIPVGGSTGWLTTTAPVTPGDHIKLRFVIFDEGDGIYDSSALIDNFKWLPSMITAPVTIQ